MNELLNIIPYPMQKRRIREVMLALRKLIEVHQRIEAVRAMKLKMTIAETRCLWCFNQDRYLTVKGLAESLGLVKSRISRIVDGLVANGLLRRQPDVHDGRIRLLGLTPAGEKKLAQLNECCYEAFRQILENMSPERKNIILGVLNELSERMETVLPGNLR
jgi:DNA-binding MarR family transcriptional regulator